MTKSAKEVTVESSATVGLGTNSPVIHGIRYDSSSTAMELRIPISWLVKSVKEPDCDVTRYGLESVSCLGFVTASVTSTAATTVAATNVSATTLAATTENALTDSTTLTTIIGGAWTESARRSISFSVTCAYNSASLDAALVSHVVTNMLVLSSGTQASQAIQGVATGLRLHVVMPSVSAELCISYCPSEAACGLLVSRVMAAVAKSPFSDTNPQEGTFVVKHSLVATCANFMGTHQQFQYAGLMEFGGYVDMNGTSSLPNYGVPLLHMAGELDGGAARPGKFAYFNGWSKTWGEAHGETARSFTCCPRLLRVGGEGPPFWSDAGCGHDHHRPRRECAPAPQCTH